MNNNVKLAFERYTNYIAIKRRDSMLKWSLELSPCILDINPICIKNLEGCTSPLQFQNTQYSTLWKQSLITPQIFLKLVNPQLRNLISLKKHLRLFKRDFTSTTTRFFDNNFDIIVDSDTSANQIQEDAENRYHDICNELKIFNKNFPETFTPDIITKVSKLFDWLYSNKQYQLSFQLLKNLSPHYNIFFKFNQYSKIIEVIDKYGEPNDLFEFCEIFKYDKIPNIWRKIERLNNDKSISQLIELSNTSLFENAKPLLDNLLSDKSSNGLKFFTFRISSLLYRNFDSKSRTQFYNYLLSLDDNLKKFFVPSLISQMFTTFSIINNYNFELQYQFIENFFKLHHDPKNINENSYQYKLISSLPRENIQTLKFKLWFNYCYNINENLNYDREIESIVYLKNNKMHYLPRGFEDILNFDEVKLDKVMSILIYTHSKYELKSNLGQVFFRLKQKMMLESNKVDKIGYLKSLKNSRQYNKAFYFLKKCLIDDPNFESDETLNPILIVLARNKDWQLLEKIYNERYENNEVISKDQYITLFIALSVRPGTTKIIMELWENYLKRGFEPNENILSSIIQSFINNKSFEESLQWFAAYSHYNVELTSKSYGLMLNALAGLQNNESVFKVLDELVSKNVRIHKLIFPPVFTRLASLGDYKSIEAILTTYYPKFHLTIEREDTRWIMKSHYHANRFDIIVNTYLKMNINEITYKDSLLALESAIKFKSVKTFGIVWEKAFKIHYDRGDLDIRAYISYMSYWIRKNGAFGIELKLNEIKDIIKCSEFPTILFNQMIFSCLRTQRPWLTKKIVKIALLNNVVPSPKTYSLILQSNVCMPWIARNSIEETITILEEFLVNRKEDKFGKLNDDINPMSLKLVLKSVIKYKDVSEARRLFEIYVESSRDNLLNNLHILNIELMILGEEERWIEFDGCYDRYMNLLYELIEKSKFQNSELNERYDNIEFNRLDINKDIYLQQNYDDKKINKFNDMNTKIPSWIKKAHSDIWIHRLRQLEVAERLGEVNEIVDELFSKGIIFDNKNLNETALFLSSRPEVLGEAASFIDKFILPYHIKNQNFKKMKLRYTTDKIPGIIRKPKYEFERGVYFEVMKNISDNLNEKLTPEQREDLLGNISMSPNKYILKNLDQIMKERRHIRSSYLQTKKLRTTFYRDIRNKIKMQTKKRKKNMNMWRLKDIMDYKNRMNELRKKMDIIVRNIHEIKSDKTDDKHSRRIKESSSVMYDLISEKKMVRGRMNQLRKEKNKKLTEIINNSDAIDRSKARPYKVGRIDFNKL